MLRVIVAGSRDFNDYELLYKKMNHYLSGYKTSELEIVSGGARGADSLGERYAKEKGIGIQQFIPDLDGLGNSAGYIRNHEMALYADACIVFWDGKSRGTRHMINLAKKEGLSLRVVIYK